MGCVSHDYLTCSLAILNRAQLEEVVPQGLKPPSLSATYGTAEEGAEKWQPGRKANLRAKALFFSRPMRPEAEASGYLIGAQCETVSFLRTESGARATKQAAIWEDGQE